ncbi:hypothetical protein OH76DRAFT_181778 [Lentinus brumalis]|uniref:Uncharacterized protein n=1 Tax=Lentinus brumalis TaxID=2498619 RepID=A0A371CND7_9APHY|nr:hypothetical protein OH76DRAFT_181778 [Polyporus brumalis]
MADFDDQMILEVLVPHIEIKINWPGYDNYELNFTSKVRLSEPGGGEVSCKGELAMAVARAYDLFLKNAPSIMEPTPSVNDAPFVIKANDLSQLYKIENLALVSLFLEKGDRPGVLHTTVELLDRRIPPGLAAFPLAYHPRQYGLHEAGAAETMARAWSAVSGPHHTPVQ